MPLKTSITCFVVLVAAIPASARIINVPADYPTIQAGIDASVSGDTVLVAPGEYTENISINGKEITLTSSNGPYETTILGHIVISGFSDTASCTIQGFTQVGQERNPYGGQPGIRINSGKPRIIGNIVTNNVWQGMGGAVFVHSQYALIQYNTIRDNWAVAEGGGIGILEATEAEICYNIITHNESGLVYEQAGMGGGISCQGGARISYNLIYNNRAQCFSYPNQGCGLGGGIMVYARACKIYNNTVVKNYVRRVSPNPPYEGGEGSGIYVAWYEPAETLVIENNVIAFNHRGGLHLDVGGRPFMERYNLIFGNDYYDLIVPETSATDIFADPLFVDTAQNDFRLLPDSPCIDAGNPEYPPDPDSTRVDIGALFFDQLVDIIDDHDAEAPFDFELSQNYPNPFNAQTAISYELPNPAIVSLIIYDLTGKVIRRLVKSECQEPGPHAYSWDATDGGGTAVSTSIYFYELEIDGKRLVKSMILIK